MKDFHSAADSQPLIWEKRKQREEDDDNYF
jgi:hypothetical protein